LGKIVVAYDGSEPAKKALTMGERLLKEGDETIIISVVPRGEMERLMEISPVFTREDFENLIDETTFKLRDRGVRVKGFVLEGEVADEIIEFAAKVNCDLIILGHKGVSKTSSFTLGSVADKVSRSATRPVLIVR
jgi:nucleotide-binding universal stress UspA family protein